MVTWLLPLLPPLPCVMGGPKSFRWFVSTGVSDGQDVAVLFTRMSGEKLAPSSEKSVPRCDAGEL